jgi:hypothetical protein
VVDVRVYTSVFVFDGKSCWATFLASIGGIDGDSYQARRNSKEPISAA